MAAETAAPSILLLDQDDPGRPGYVSLMSQFRTVIAEKLQKRPSIYTENIDYARFNGPEYRDEAEAWMRRKYRDKKIDVVIAVGEVSMQFAQGLRDELWRQSPIVVISMGSEALDTASVPDARILNVPVDVGGTVAAAKMMLPNARELVFIQGAGSAYQELDRRIREKVHQAAQNHSLRVRELVGLSMNETKARLAKLPRDVIVIYGGISVDGEGRSFIPRDALKDLVAVSEIPVFGLSDTYVGHGAIGGSCIRLAELGRELAGLTGDVLAEKSSGKATPITSKAYGMVFDWRQLVRHGLTHSPLPDGSEVQFKPITLWDSHRNTVIWGGAAMVAQSFLIVSLMVQRRQRQNAERVVIMQRDHLAHVGRVSVMGQLAASLAHELSQPLGAILHNAEAANRFLSQPDPDLAELRLILSDIRADDSRACAVIDRMRSLLRKQQMVSLPVKIRELVDEVFALMKFDAQIRKVMLESMVSPALPAVWGDSIQLQQVLINLLVNAMESLEGREDGRVRIGASPLAGGMIELFVADNGPGFSEEERIRLFEPFYTTKPEGLGMGLSICQTIVEAHGGLITTVPPGKGEGAVFRITLPVNPKH